MSENFDIVYESRKRRDEDRLFYPQSIYQETEHGHSVHIDYSRVGPNILNFEVYDFSYYKLANQWTCKVRTMLYDVSNPTNNELRLR
jgi:hypothetical protein